MQFGILAIFVEVRNKNHSYHDALLWFVEKCKYFHGQSLQMCAYAHRAESTDLRKAGRRFLFVYLAALV